MMRKVWAVAANTIAQIIRLKVAITTIVLLVILLPVMGFIVTGDGTLTGKLQTFSSYGLSLTSILLCILTVSVASYTLSHDFKEKLLFSVVTKPVARFQVIIGKLLGICICTGVLLALFSGLIYGLTKAMPSMIEADDAQRLEAADEFFTSRKSIKVEIDRERLKALATADLDEKVRTGEVSNDPVQKAKFFVSFFGERLSREKRIAPGMHKVWTFENIRPLPGQKYIQLKYKLESSITGVDEVVAAWLYGDIDGFQAGRPTNVSQVPFAKLAVGSVKTLKVPVEYISDENKIQIGLINYPAGGVSFSAEDVELLFKAGSFEANFIRSVILIYFRVIFLATLGVVLTTWLSFPVALFACIVFFFVGMTNGFISESIESIGQTMDVVYRFTIKPVLWLLPKFDGQYNPTGYIVSARMISWFFLARVLVFTVLIKSALLAIFGMFVFSRREVARTSV